MPLSSQARRERAKLASTAARAAREPDDPDIAEELDERRRDYRFAAASDYIREVVDAAPPLTDQQRRQLAALLTEGDAA